jgi:hypothetical protein
VWRHDRRGRLRRRPQQGEWSRKSHCKSCDRQRALAYYDTHRDELYAKREAVREAAWQAELKALEKEHRKRVAANKKQHDAQVRRQKEFLRSIGVPDVSPEEVTERASDRPSAGAIPCIAGGAVRAREPLGGRGKPALPTFAYGVGSANVPPKMSLLPNVPGQSEFGAGVAMGVGVVSDWRYASTAGQSAALRTST